MAVGFFGNDMTECDDQLLSAFHDGELPPAAQAGVELHLMTCSRCAAQLAELQATSRLFEPRPDRDLTADELQRIHTAVEDANAQHVWRIFTAITALAASVLIIGAVWLAEFSVPVQPAGEGTVTAVVEPWETVATTLRPTPAEMFEQGQEPATAKATLDEWMLQGILQESN